MRDICCRCGQTDELNEDDECENCAENHEIDPESDFIMNGGIFAGDE